MGEKTKRLEPTKDVIRELSLRSGNQCAFPGCHNIMMDELGNFIGQVCHIEAAEEGGERFNPNMTNEERRSADNLMLMCYEHHIVTNDVINYPVTELKKMKKDHEDKSSGIIQKMINSVVDHGIVKNYSKSFCCKRLSDVLEYGCSDEENIENSKVLNRLLDKMINLPIETRCLLAIMVMRSHKDIVDQCMVALGEIELATGKDAAYIAKNIDILNRRDLISEPDEEFGYYTCRLYGDKTGWNCWNDIREFCKKTGVPAEKICVELDFLIFD